MSSSHATAANTHGYTVGLLGYGTIGSAIHRLLVQHADHVRHATGRTVDVAAALVRDPLRSRDTGGSQLSMVGDIDALFGYRLDLACEAMGGLEPARSYVLAALERGVPVVTANKQLIAHHGPELFAAAEAANTQLRFEASVCGAIPVIKMLRESLAATRIERVVGILNGTTNYMLSHMADNGVSYEAALAGAQDLGYAEPDPTDDVTGVDAAAKLAILAGIAFHTRVPIDAVRAIGITGVTADDVSYAHVLGFRVKLVGRALRVDGSIALDVTPAMVPERHPLASVSGALNAVLVGGAPFGELMVQGAGAGGPETASALAGDIVSVMGSAPSFLTRDPQRGDPFSPADASAVHERFYVRMRVPDRPGVLAQVAQRFAERDVSIERVIQQRSVHDTATLVITTHPTSLPALRGAMDAGARRDGNGNRHGAEGTGPAEESTLMPIMESGT